MNAKKGFTLIELLVVIAIIATLAVLVIVALDPKKRFEESRNARRWTDVSSINNAIHLYAVDNQGSFPAGLTADATVYQLGSCSSDGNILCSGAQDACLDLSSLLTPYLKSLPIDPLGGSATTTGYKVSVNTNNIVTVGACRAERSAVIQVSQ